MLSVTLTWLQRRQAEQIKHETAYAHKDSSAAQQNTRSSHEIAICGCPVRHLLLKICLALCPLPYLCGDGTDAAVAAAPVSRVVAILLWAVGLVAVVHCSAPRDWITARISACCRECDRSALVIKSHLWYRQCSNTSASVET